MSGGDRWMSLFDGLEAVDVVERRDGYTEAIEEYRTSVEPLGEAYIEWVHSRRPREQAHDSYGQALERAEDLEFDAAEIYRFCREEQLSGDDGLFASALLSTVPDDTVYLPGMPAVNDIGYRARRDQEIRILGNTGERVGHAMQSGYITIRGNAQQEAGAGASGGTLTILGDAADGVGRGMQGGTVRVLGDAAEDAGREMQHGLLIIHGDAGKNLGDRMAGGNIAVYGDVESVGTDSRAGSLYVDGDLGGRLDRDAPALVRKPWQLAGIQRPF